MKLTDYDIKVGDIVASITHGGDLVSMITNYRGEVESIDGYNMVLKTVRCDGYPKMIGKRITDAQTYNFLPCSLYPNESNHGMWNCYIHDRVHEVYDKIDESKKDKKEKSKVVHPNHYNSNGKETIEKIRDMVGDDGYKGFLVGNVIKYIDRYPFKNGIEDIEKAEYYIGLLKKFETEKKKDSVHKKN